MSVSEAVRSVWSPGDRVVTASSGEGRAPEVGYYTAPSPGVVRHRLWLTALTAAALAVGPLAAEVGTMWAPPILLAPILLTAGLLLRLGAGVVILLAAVVSVLMTLTAGVEPMQLAVLGVVAALSLRLAANRGGIGLHGLRGDRALIQLKQRLRAHNQMPALPRGWGRKVAIQAAPGALFGGDFLVSLREGQRLQLALVDVSGKGDDVVSHAMLLSGTFSGMLGAVPPEEYLRACNTALMRSRDERLVTAVHLHLDLSTGEYTVTCAGHPPTAQYHAGSGRWTLSPARGLALGVSRDATWTGTTGQLGKGDALMLVSDGMWGPRVDPEVGMDRLLGKANILQQSGFATGASALVREAAHREDDAAIVLIWRG